jgi:hypothetical protein
MNQGLLIGTTRQSVPPLPFTNGGATFTGSAQLGNPGVYTGNMSSAGQFLQLPSPIANVGNGIRYVIQNSGSFAFDILDNLGNYKCTIYPGQVVGAASSPAVAAWVVSNLSLGGEIATAKSLVATVLQAATNSKIFSMCSLSNTQALIMWSGAGGSFGAILTFTGTSVVAGTVVGVSGAATCITCSAVSATQAIFVLGTGSSTNAWGLTVSGTGASATFTFSASSLQIQAISSAFAASAPLSATQIILAYTSGNTSATMSILTLSGTGTAATVSATVGTSPTTSGTFSGSASLDMLTLGSAYIFTAGVNGNPVVLALTVSGTTITYGSVLAAQQLSITSSPSNSALAISSSQAIVANSYNGAGTTLTLLSISGTALTTQAEMFVGKVSGPRNLAKIGTNSYLLVGLYEVVKFSIDSATNSFVMGSLSPIGLSLYGQSPAGDTSHPIFLNANTCIIPAITSSLFPCVQTVQIGV